MKSKIRFFASQSHLDVYSLGRDRAKWEDVLQRYTELVVQECVGVVENLSPGYKDYRDQIEDAFRRDCIEEIKKQFGMQDESI
jgi:hypothetical protein